MAFWSKSLGFLVLFTLPESRGSHPFFSSCNFITRSEKEGWISNSGVEIQSWISSMVPLAGRPRDKEASAAFTRSGNLLGVREISSRSGVRWKAFGDNRFDGWLYGLTDGEGGFRPGATYYLFPDYKTALVGTFDEEGRLSEGRETKARKFRCRGGVMELQFGPVDESGPLFRYTERNSSFMSEFPKRRDPLERRNVYIGETRFHPEGQIEEGLMARRDLPPYNLISYYNGVWTCFEGGVLSPNMTLDEREDKLKNLLRFNETHCLDVPGEYSELTAYRSTLSHKVNHHFLRANSKFCWAKHPLYGKIRCLESIDTIPRGNEILAHYGYKIDGRFTPRWYNRLYRRTFGIKKR